MTEYAFIVAASENYLPGLKAMFNSLEVLGNEQDVVLLSYKLPSDFLGSLSTYSFDVEVIESIGDHQIHATAIERFRIAVDVGQDRKAVCLLDADMFFVSNVDLFFQIASKGFIVTGSNGMMINFDKKYQDKFEVDLGQRSYLYLKTHTSVPIFISKLDLDWFDALYHSRRYDYWDDFLYLNILGIKMSKDKKMLCMPPYAFTGIHHWHLKPVIHVICKGGHLVSGTEQPIYMVHGKWWDQGWYDDLEKVMRRYCEENEQCFKIALHSRQILKEEFEKRRNMK